MGQGRGEEGKEEIKRATFPRLLTMIVVFQFLTLRAETNNTIIKLCIRYSFEVNGFWHENDVERLEILFTKTLLAEVTLFEYNVSLILLLIVGSDVVMVTTCTWWTVGSNISCVMMKTAAVSIATKI